MPTSSHGCFPGVRPDVASLMARRRYWNVLREVAIAQYKQKDQSTVFGYAWSFLHPLAMLAVLFVFFRARAGAGIDHYAIYLLVGLVQFAHFSASTTGGMLSLHHQRALVCNTIVPKEVLVFGVVLSKAPEFVVSLAICVGVALATGVRPGWALAALPLVAVLQLVVVLWVSLVLSALYVFVRDTEYVYQVGLRVLFLVTPIFYSADFVGQGVARLAITVNPLAQLMDIGRAAIIGNTPVSATRLALAVALNLPLLLAALAVFRAVEPRFAEHV